MMERVVRAFAPSVALALLSGCASATETPAVEADVYSVVEDFGSRLQRVSLLSPTVEEDMRQEYADLVSPELLEQWIFDPSSAPGRLTSSPWPDRVDIHSVESVSDTRYAITGEIVEITSTEVGSDEAANRIPIRLTVEKSGEHWVITDLEQGADAP